MRVNSFVLKLSGQRERERKKKSWTDGKLTFILMTTRYSTVSIHQLNQLIQIKTNDRSLGDVHSLILFCNSPENPLHCRRLDYYYYFFFCSWIGCNWRKIVLSTQNKCTNEHTPTIEPYSQRNKRMNYWNDEQQKRVESSINGVDTLENRRNCR